MLGLELVPRRVGREGLYRRQSENAPIGSLRRSERCFSVAMELASRRERGRPRFAPEADALHLASPVVTRNHRADGRGADGYPAVDRNANAPLNDRGTLVRRFLKPDRGLRILICDPGKP
jgi:hypothetical protein